MDTLFSWANLHYKNVVYLKSGFFKSGFSGKYSILAFDLKEKRECGDINEIDNFINRNQANERFENFTFCLLPYESGDIFTSNVLYQTFNSKSNALTVRQKILLYTFNQVIVYDNELGKVIYHKAPLVDISTLGQQKNTFDVKIEKFSSNMTDDYYLYSVEKIINKIKNGDLLQVNFTRKYFSSGFVDNLDILFLKLIFKSKSFYSAFFKDEDFILISSSPERLFCKNNNTITSNPIKGSVKISESSTKTKIEEELLNVKNRAENLMITDLIRNELSMISKAGDVKAELFKMDFYPHIAHLSSQVSCLINDEIKPSQILKAIFPPGSMTGAPKLAAIKVALELEASPRGFYSGSIGYFDYFKNGYSNVLNADFSVIIRSIIFRQLEGKNYYKIETQAGGGITHLSNPLLELEELKAKLSMIFDVLKED